MKRPLTVLLILLAAGLAAGFGYYYFYISDHGSPAGQTNSKTVYVNHVEELAEISDAGGEIPRYGGEIEPLETKTIRLESGQNVAKTYVKVGDRVKKKTKLFMFPKAQRICSHLSVWTKIYFI